MRHNRGINFIDVFFENLRKAQARASRRERMRKRTRSITGMSFTDLVHGRKRRSTIALFLGILSFSPWRGLRFFWGALAVDLICEKIKDELSKNLFEMRGLKICQSSKFSGSQRAVINFWDWKSGNLLGRCKARRSLFDRHRRAPCERISSNIWSSYCQYMKMPLIRKFVRFLKVLGRKWKSCKIVCLWTPICAIATQWRRNLTVVVSTQRWYYWWYGRF